MTKNLEEHGLFSLVQQRTNHKDFQNCLFACFLSQEEPKKVIHALKDPSWIEAMQEELLQFKLQEVWTLVELPRLKRKLCLSTPGFEDPGTSLQEYTKGKDRQDFVYQKGQRGYSVSSSMSSMGELTFFLGLQVKQKEDGIFISQDKYVTEILKKFSFTDVKTASTPMETQKLLLKDEDGEEVDVHLYRSMIGSLMYLTSSRPDIMFSFKNKAYRD
ncbi:putative ribonuclease H-like domain-containing protein [Tanacetum coccineum]